MRKLLKHLLCLGLILQLCSAAALAGETATAEGDSSSTEDKGLPGIWKIVEMNIDGEITTREDSRLMESMKLVTFFNIDSDGTLLMKSSDYDEQGCLELSTLTDGTWDENEIILDGISISYTLDGDNLTMNGDGAVWTLERSSMEAISAAMGYKEGVLDENASYSEKEEVLVDTDEFLMKIKGYKADAFGFSVIFNFENKTDRQILIRTFKCLVNRCVMNPDWEFSLEAKESIDSALTCSALELEKHGITVADELILEPVAFYADSYDLVTEEGKRFTLYPTGKKNVDIQFEDRIPAENETVVIDDENMLFVIQGAEEDFLKGYAVNYYFENRTDKYLFISFIETSINNKKVSYQYFPSMLPGTRGYMKGCFSFTALEEAGINIDEVNIIKGTVKVQDTEDPDNPMYHLMHQKEFSFKP